MSQTNTMSADHKDEINSLPNYMKPLKRASLSFKPRNYSFLPELKENEKYLLEKRYKKKFFSVAYPSMTLLESVQLEDETKSSEANTLDSSNRASPLSQANSPEPFQQRARRFQSIPTNHKWKNSDMTKSSQAYKHKRQSLNPNAFRDSRRKKSFFNGESKGHDTRSPSEGGDLRIGSMLSEDGCYAMLKTYEDMLYKDMLLMYPKEQLTRTKTSVYTKMPRKLSTIPTKLPPLVPEAVTSAESKKEEAMFSEPSTNQVTIRGEIQPNSRPRKSALVRDHQLRVTREINTAMNLVDKVSAVKKETHIKNSQNYRLLLEYINWKNSWNQIASQNAN